MATITKKDFAELANVHGGRCFSIFLPTHRGGKEVLNREDQLLFKNLLIKIEEEMDNRGFSKEGTREFMEPVTDLLTNGDFWRNQSNGLAVFLTKNYLRHYALPMHLEPFYYFANEFYLKPLLPALMHHPEFYLLSLNFHEVKLFKGNKEALDEIYLAEALPQRVEEVVGFDYRQKFLGYHAQQGGHSQAIFHGHGDWQEDEKDEILAYFRAVDKAVTNYLGPSSTPLIIASLDYLFPLYEKANTYGHLFPEHVAGNPEFEKPARLHKKSLDLLTFGFEKVKEEKKNLFNQLLDTKRTSTDIHQIIPAAIGGQVDTLFIAKKYEAWGVYDQRDATVRIHEVQNLSNTSLSNLAAVSVFLNGGLVYLEERENLPFSASGMNALFRY